MKTRKQYMNREVTHREFYRQFVFSGIKHLVSIRIGKDRIINSEDEDFNDIPLKEWDTLHNSIFTYCGGLIANANETGGVSLSDCVCVAKEAAKQIREESK